MKIKTIPDEELLEMILDGVLTLKNKFTSDPIVCKNGRELKPKIVPGKRNPRYAVIICRPKRKRERKRRKRTIVRAKIVWMIHKRRVVPFGHELHHKDDNRLNDSASNIVDWTEERHKEYHNSEVPF